MIGESYGWRWTRNEGDKKEKKKERKEEWKEKRMEGRVRERRQRNGRRGGEIQSTYISHHKLSP